MWNKKHNYSQMKIVKKRGQPDRIRRQFGITFDTEIYSDIEDFLDNENMSFSELAHVLLVKWVIGERHKCKVYKEEIIKKYWELIKVS